MSLSIYNKKNNSSVWQLNADITCDFCQKVQNFAIYNSNNGCIKCGKKENVYDKLIFLDDHPITFNDMEACSTFKTEWDSLLSLSALMDYIMKIRFISPIRLGAEFRNSNKQEIYVFFHLSDISKLQKIGVRAYQNGKEKGYIYPSTFNNTPDKIHEVFQKVMKLL